MVTFSQFWSHFVCRLRNGRLFSNPEVLYLPFPWSDLLRFLITPLPPSPFVWSEWKTAALYLSRSSNPSDTLNSFNELISTRQLVHPLNSFCHELLNAPDIETFCGSPPSSFTSFRRKYKKKALSLQVYVARLQFFFLHFPCPKTLLQQQQTSWHVYRWVILINERKTSPEQKNYWVCWNPECLTVKKEMIRVALMKLDQKERFLPLNSFIHTKKLLRLCRPSYCVVFYVFSVLIR